MPVRPFQFCRYEISVGDEVLSAAGQRVFFMENQGQPMPFRGWGSDEVDSTIWIMEPKILSILGREAISVLIGLQPGVRPVVGYDPTAQVRTFKLSPDSHIKTAHLILVPELNAIAIQDRNNELCFPASAAIRVLRSAVRGFFSSGADFSIVRLSKYELRKAFEEWALTEYSYTIRPLNPVILSDLTNLRSDKMKEENVARESAKLKAPEGETMKPNGGPISQTQEMVEAGYGQNGFAGITPDGHRGQVPKPTFHMDKSKNLKEQEKPRPIRMLFEVEDYDVHEHVIAETVARALVNLFDADA